MLSLNYAEHPPIAIQVSPFPQATSTSTINQIIHDFTFYTPPIFAAIEPNSGIVTVPDDRLHVLSGISKSKDLVRDMLHLGGLTAHECDARLRLDEETDRSAGSKVAAIDSEVLDLQVQGSREHDYGRHIFAAKP